MVQEELKKQLQRVIRASQPDQLIPVLRGERRTGCRHLRVMPVLVVPFRGGNSDVHNCLYGVTRDLSDSGISIVVQNRLDSDRVVIGFWEPTQGQVGTSPRSVLFPCGSVQYNEAVGGGFWQLGIDFDGPYDDPHVLSELKAQMARLLPEHDLPAAAI